MTIPTPSPRTLASVILPLLFCGALLLGALPQSAEAVSRGIVDARLERVHPPVAMSAVQAIVDGMGQGQLQARWSRVLVSWKRLQPVDPATLSSGQPTYDAAYVAELDAVVNALRAEGMTVMMTATDVPEWASDPRYSSGTANDPDIAMRIGDAAVRRQFTDFAAFLAGHFAGRIRYFEVWNEPNLGSGIFPQLKGKTAVGPQVYVKMLKAFHDGAKSAASNAFIIAGATAPRGSNNQYSTSPQRFAQYLKSHGATKWFDGYSHHPYTPGGSRNAAPNRPPNNPSRCVTLYNLKVLMKLFPSKPFFLTEFGYNTHQSKLFGLKVSPANQARYLRQAYSMVSRMKRVKALLWYLVVDWCPDPATPTFGAYCGLFEVDGVTRKPAWFAFAGGNKLSVNAPRSVKARALFTVSGVLTTRLGPGESVKVLLQGRRKPTGAWSRVATRTTTSGGAYSFTIRQKPTRWYRVVWDGVCESAQKKVRTR